MDSQIEINTPLPSPKRSFGFAQAGLNSLPEKIGRGVGSPTLQSTAYVATSAQLAFRDGAVGQNTSQNYAQDFSNPTGQRVHIIFSLFFTIYRIFVSLAESKSGYRTILLALAIITVIPLKNIIAQPIPVGDIREDQYRLLQLLSDSTSHGSFMNRPLWTDVYKSAFKSLNTDTASLWTSPLSSKTIETTYLDYPITIGFFDPVISNTFNTELPYGENNGAAWYGKGSNVEFKGGAYLISEYATLTFRPHIIYTENSDFKTPNFIPIYRRGPLEGTVRYVAQGILPEDILAERIDRPFRFGPDSYATFDLGHSSARAHYNKLELGFGTEPLWWGPGKQYALMMSNNAAGVPHAFLGSRSPISLPLNIGRFEFRWIAGFPQDSKYFDLEIYQDTRIGYKVERERFLRNRFLNGLNVVFSPSFAPNLYVGLSRMVHQYIPEDCSIDNTSGVAADAVPNIDPNLTCDDINLPDQKKLDIFSVFKPFPNPDEQAIGSPFDESHFQDMYPISSLYFRWVFPKSSAEVYGEYFRNNHNWNFRDFLMEPQHGRAYTLGAQKIIGSNWINFFKVNAEINSLLPGRIDDIRPQTYYYTHKSIKQGHTNKGQVLGAAIGPGSTSQYLGVDGYFNKGMAGIFIQRVVENDHFHYEFNQRFFPGGGFKDQFRHRVNLNVGANVQYKFGPVLLHGKAVWNKNFNYGRFNYGEFPIGYETREGTDVVNMQFQVSVRYLF